MRREDAMALERSGAHEPPRRSASPGPIAALLRHPRSDPPAGEASYGRVAGKGVDVAHGVVLYLEDISVRFDGFAALDHLSLAIDAGELRCVIGPNGAGKTTMMDVITGRTRPDEGRAWFGQSIDLTRYTEAQIAHAGIGRKFQKPTIFERHTAFENLELAMKADKRVRRTLFARLDSAERDRIAAMLERVRLAHSADRPAGLLSHGQKQWLEIAMLLMQEPRLLLLDEPVAGMSDEERERTADLFVSLAGQHSLVVVEHDMAFIAKIARKVTVLHEGRVLAEGPLESVQADPRVIEVYLGR
ncbi:MAG TPA: urea ABC transporter ATP-binding protein UrtD [Usitatibacter sp.]|nr:urea ABC transporter ATP-binding protein UrtD [Usitatibacter sp.]